MDHCQSTNLLTLICVMYQRGKDVFIMYLHKMVSKCLTVLHIHSFFSYLVMAGERDLLPCHSPGPWVSETHHNQAYSQRCLPNLNLPEQETRSSTIIKKVAARMLQSIGTTVNTELYHRGKRANFDLSSSNSIEGFWWLQLHTCGYSIPRTPP